MDELNKLGEELTNAEKDLIMKYWSSEYLNEDDFMSAEDSKTYWAPSDLKSVKLEEFEYDPDIFDVDHWF